jgi:hypothetical protein
MPTNITFSRIQSYLDAIADNPSNVGDIDISPHGRFWRVSHDDFVKGVVPGGQQVECQNKPTPIIDSNNPAQSPFYLILTASNGFCNMPRMPKGGPFITDSDYQVTLADGTTVTGAQIQRDLLEWLTNGFPQ